MLDQGLRTAILSLRAKGHGIRQIARALQIARGTVRAVLHAGSPTVPRIERAEKAEPYRAQILEWVERCRGNLVRVHEELGAQGLVISYPALTAFCRRHAIGHAPPAPVGHYDFAPAQEMQHDSSPHRAVLHGVEQRIETASVVLCYSRMLFFQAYPVFTRFCCKGLPDRRPREQKRSTFGERRRCRRKGASNRRRPNDPRDFPNKNNAAKNH